MSLQSCLSASAAAAAGLYAGVDVLEEEEEAVKRGMAVMFTIKRDHDFEVWDAASEVMEEMFKRKLCEVTKTLTPDDFEIVRVSVGSVVVDAMIHSPDWREALVLLQADVNVAQVKHLLVG